MSTKELKLSGHEFAEHLAASLTNLEFELLVRFRIKRGYDIAKHCNPNLSDSHSNLSFHYRAGDKCEWNVHMGATYNDSITATGEVLDATFHQARMVYDHKTGNTLSRLLTSEVDDTTAHQLLREIEG